MEAVYSALEQEKTYWQYFNFSADPFAWGDTDLEVHRHIPYWEQELDLLHHLIHNCNVLLTVESDDYSVVSTLRMTLLEQLQEEKICIFQIENPAQLTQERLPALFAEHFNVPYNQNMSIELQLENQLTEMQYQSHLSLLVISNAEQLTAGAIKTLLNLICEQSENQMHFHVVLFGNNATGEKIESVATAIHAADMTHCSKLSPLNRMEIKQYIHGRLKCIGKHDAAIFNDVDIARIHKLSKGNIKQINHVAKQILTERMFKALKKQTSPLLKLLNNKILKEQKVTIIGGSVILMAIMIISYFSHQDDTSSVYLDKKINIDEFIQYPTAASIPGIPKFKTKSRERVVAKVKITPIPTDLPEYTRSEVPGSAPVVKTGHYKNRVELIANDQFLDAIKKDRKHPLSLDRKAKAKIKKSITDKIAKFQIGKTIPQAEPQETPNKAAAAVPSILKLKKIPLVKKQVKRSKPIPIKKITTALSNPKATISKKLIRTLSKDEKDLLSIPKRHYTIQLFAARKKVNLKQIKKIKLPKRSYEYMAMRKGKKWYIVIYGDFPTVEEAQAAIRALPKSLKVHSPWIKAVSNIQNEINKQ